MTKAGKRKKLNNQGFTLVEMLVVILILSLLTFMMAMIMPTATKAFFNVVDSANAQVLLSTEINELRDEMGTATDIEVGKVEYDNKEYITVKYRSGNTGNFSTIFIISDGITVKDDTDLREGIYILKQESKSINDLVENDMLVTKAAATYKLTICCSSVEYIKSTGVITFSNIFVHNKDKSKILSSQDELVIRTEKDDEE